MSKVSFSYGYCPDCQKWIPSEYMNYFDGLRVCNWCLNQEQNKPPHDRFAYDPNAGKLQCIMCDSYETEYIKGSKPGKWKCRECGEEFFK